MCMGFLPWDFFFVAWNRCFLEDHFIGVKISVLPAGYSRWYGIDNRKHSLSSCKWFAGILCDASHNFCKIPSFSNILDGTWDIWKSFHSNKEGKILQPTTGCKLNVYTSPQISKASKLIYNINRNVENTIPQASTGSNSAVLKHQQYHLWDFCKWQTKKIHRGRFFEDPFKREAEWDAAESCVMCCLMRVNSSTSGNHSLPRRRVVFFCLSRRQRRPHVGASGHPHHQHQPKYDGDFTFFNLL